MITSILTPLLSKLLRYLIGGLCTYLVAKGYADSEAAGGIGEHLSALIPQVIGILFAVGWDLWAHIAKTSFIAKVQDSLGLPVTGKPTAEAASIIKAIGEDMGTMPLPRPSGGIIPLLILAPFLLLTVAACAVDPFTGNPKGAPKLDDGRTQIDNACVVDAIVCYNNLKNTGADPQILQIDYVISGVHYGHWMTLFSWPPPAGAKNSADYLFDRTNKSTPLPSYVDPNSAFQVARFAIPQTVASPSTRWIDPKDLSKLPTP